jgi:Xaa-Pro aminopeptidase
MKLTELPTSTALVSQDPASSIASCGARRKRLLDKMRHAGGGVAIIPTANEAVRNGDADYPFRHDSSFYYLSGFMEPEAVIVLATGCGGTPDRSFLFCREKNQEREIWDGFRYGPAVAKTTFGFDAAFAVADLDQELPRLMADTPALFYALGRDTQLDAKIQGWLASVRSQSRAGIKAPSTVHDIRPLVDDMRLIKDTGEISLMRHAAAISGGAHARAMRLSQPGKTEYQIEAELLHEFRYAGADFPAYTSIVATGANACVLHYRAGNTKLKDGDLVLIDAGCEYGSYASDITRTYPANGRFSEPQARLYDIVLAAQAAAIDAARPGNGFMDGHDAAVKILVEGMLETGLLNRETVGNVEDVIENGSYRQFYMHRTGHWLGMDVHDVGDYRESATDTPKKKSKSPHKDFASADSKKPWRKLQPGMVLTVEPGLYVRPAEGVPEQYWNIGIRIEDDIAVTEDTPEVLSISAPKTRNEIEKIMQNKK